jgi:lipopolysaccharide transport system permease protein
MKSLINEIWKNRFLLIKMTQSDINSKYAGQVIGKLWIILSPLAFLSIYTLIYSFVLKLSPSGLSKSEYIVYIFCGLIPYLCFTDSLNQSANCFKTNESILKNFHFPIVIMPIKSVALSHISLIVSVVMITFSATLVSSPGLSLLLLPICLIFQFLFLTGAGMIISLLAVAFKDISQMIIYFNMLLMVASPIAYDPSIVPARFKFIIWLNPLTYFIDFYRSVILFNKIPSLYTTTLLIGMSVTSFLIGAFAFKQVKKVILNYV